MKQIIFRLTITLLTFAVGITLADSLRAVTSDQPGAHPRISPVPHVNLYDEAVLRNNLSRMRELISRYKVDRRESLRSLDDLIRAGYLRELPIDPLTGARDWQPEGVGCPSQSGFYFFDITGLRSSSKAISSEGVPYSEW